MNKNDFACTRVAGGENLGDTRFLNPDSTQTLAYQEVSITSLSVFYQRRSPT